uniref:Uncharacterized protein n=1 Tax=Craspedostauros australis TaxID=1486917 RepID=A0A7R9WPK1_9STRA
MEDGEVGDSSAATAAASQQLPQLYHHVVQQPWFTAHAEGDHSSRSSLLATPVVTRSATNGQAPARAAAAADAKYRLSPTGKAFLRMDGPVGADIGRFLASFDSVDTVNISVLKSNWEQIFNLSRDHQSHRILLKIDDLLSVCVESNLIELVERQR